MQHTLLPKEATLEDLRMTGKKFVSFILSIIAVAGSITSTSKATTPIVASPSIPPIPSSPMPWTEPPSLPPSPPFLAIKGGYWPSGQAEKLPPSTIATEYFTHLFYAFVLPDPTSFQLFISQPDGQLMANFTAALHAKTPPTKALLSIGGGNSNSSTFSTIASNRDNRAGFIKSTIDVARKYHFDGLDLDWEYPKDPQDMSNLAVLFTEWRAATEAEATASGKPRLLLSAAVYFAYDFFLAETPRSYPGEAIKDYVDFVNPMCYDYHGSWDTSFTGSQALLYDKSSNISTSYGISLWTNSGVTPNKLVMGLPLYGRTWQLKDPNEHGIGAPAVGVGPGHLGTMSYANIVDFNLGNNGTEVYDTETVSTYSYAGTSWIGYDDERSIWEKVKFAKAQGLGGYFFWAVGYDQNWTISRTASMAWDSA